MKAELFDVLSMNEKMAHLSEMAGIASYEKYKKRKSNKNDKEAGETMPGRHAAKSDDIGGLFEEG